MILIIIRFEEKLVGSRKWFSHWEPTGQTWPIIFVNKVLLECRHPHSFTHCLWQLHTTMATLNSWDRDHRTYRVYREDEKEKEEEGEGEEEMKKGREEGKGRSEAGRRRKGNRQRRRDGGGRNKRGITEEDTGWLPEFLLCTLTGEKQCFRPYSKPARQVFLSYKEMGENNSKQGNGTREAS